MTTHPNPPAGVRRPQRPHALAVCDRQRTPAGSTSETRLTDILARLADADALTASRVRAWDRLHPSNAAVAVGSFGTIPSGYVANLTDRPTVLRETRAEAEADYCAAVAS